MEREKEKGRVRLMKEKERQKNHLCKKCAKYFQSLIKIDVQKILIYREFSLLFIKNQ